MSSFFTHGSLHDSMIANVLVPVIKSKTGHIMSNDNYRPIALASVVSKVAEIVIYNRISGYLDTCPNQFGFKGALYRIQILCRRYTFWSYPAGLTIADPPG